MNILVIGPNIQDQYKLGGISTFIRFLLENIDTEVSYFARSTSNRSLFKALQKVFEYIQVLRKNKYDLIHINTSLNLGSILRDYIFVKVTGNRRKILHIHGGKYINRQAPLLLRILLKNLIDNQYIVVLSELEKKSIAKLYSPKTIFVLKNSVATFFNDEVNSKIPLKKLIKPISIIYLGRIDKNKGLDFILEPLLKLKRDGVDFLFNLYGDGEYKDEIVEKMKQALGNSNFRYHGVVIGEEKMMALVNSNIFVLPSLFEGLPIALLEAMSVGRIVLTTNVGSIPSVISDGENGYLVEPGNSKQILEKLYQIINHPNPNQISLSARKTILDNFSSSYFKGAIYDIYSKTLSH